MSIIALYVQKGDTPYRRFFQENLEELQLGFLRYNYNLVFLPAITRSENPTFNDGLRQYLEVYYPSFRKLSSIQQQQAMFIVAATSKEEDVYQQLDEMFHLNLPQGAFIFYIKPGHFDYEPLPTGEDPELVLSKYLNPKSNASGPSDNDFQSNSQSLSQSISNQSQPDSPTASHADLTPRNTQILLENLSASERDEWDDFSFPKIINKARREELQGFVESTKLDDSIITPEMQRLFDTVNALQLDVGLKQLLDITILRVLEQVNAIPVAADQTNPVPLIPQNSALQIVHFNYENQLYLGETLVSLSPICRAVYRLFLQHPEGIELRLMSDFKEELHWFYLSMATHNDLSEITNRVNLLCNPLDNSINEKLSVINRTFKRLLGEESCMPYQILGVRGGPKKINLHPSFIQL